ncbi:MAG: DUF4293 domain-containing protein [Bacteroidales bacterium]|nr:DUF4293 domain-containing protein [Bacteroidales bacterium]
MFQRIQSVFLILAILISFAVFFFPLATFSVVGHTFDIFITGVKNLDADSPLDFKINMIFHLVIWIVIIIAIIATLFLYKNRLLQMKLNRFILMLNIIFIVLVFMFTDNIKKQFVKTLTIDYESVEVTFGTATIIPLVVLVLIFLAGKFIKKDEMLVRSADRLR